MKNSSLNKIACQLVAPGKGILAADESLPTIEKRFSEINISCTPDNRSDYRQLLFKTAALENYISGVILFEESLYQKDHEGRFLPDILSNKKILPGIKVDHGTIPLIGFPNEKITQGLDNLTERLTEYKKMGACFTKWRAVIIINNGSSAELVGKT